MAKHPVVFLFDVDNTLLDNDRVIADLHRYLAEKIGPEKQQRYWEIFEGLRETQGYADYLGALQHYRQEHIEEAHLLDVSLFMLQYQFANRLFPNALDVIDHVKQWGPVAIVSDGDAVFQPRKIENSGLYEAVDGKALIYIHKEQRLADIEASLPADRYVVFDDKLRILTALKKEWGTRVTTVFPRQGHYALDPHPLATYPTPDITVERIGDVLNLDLQTLLNPGARQDAPPALAQPAARPSAQPTESAPLRVLSIDLGGTNVKVKCNTSDQVLKAKSGPEMTPEKMVAAVRELTQGWDCDVVTLGYPGVVLQGKIVRDPANLGPGWVAFDFEKASAKPFKIMNDAAMQALGSYEGGRMLFLGLGTGLGTALVVNGIVEPLELGHLPYKKGRTFEDYVGVRGLERLGKKCWREEVLKVIQQLSAALQPEYVVLGGGNTRLLEEIPANCRLGDNANAFIGGFRVWSDTAVSKA